METAARAVEDGAAAADWCRTSSPENALGGTAELFPTTTKRATFANRRRSSSCAAHSMPSTADSLIRPDEQVPDPTSCGGGGPNRDRSC